MRRQFRHPASIWVAVLLLIQRVHSDRTYPEQSTDSHTDWFEVGRPDIKFTVVVPLIRSNMDACETHDTKPGEHLHAAHDTNCWFSGRVLLVELVDPTQPEPVILKRVHGVCLPAKVRQRLWLAKLT